MNTLSFAAAALAVLVLPVAASAATKHHPVAHHRAGYGAYAAQPQIACTPYGCLPVQPGCHPAGGRTLSGEPSGFDVVVCPNGSTYYGNR